MTGRIVKGIAGFYYVDCDGTVYECKARGVFRKQQIKPLVGDLVTVEVISAEEKTGNIIEILPRKNELIRPAVANIDQALVIFAVNSPAPNLCLLDKFLLSMETEKIPTIICFNKMDLATDEEQNSLRICYEMTPYEVLFVSAQNDIGMQALSEKLKGRVTTVAGPSGVGKSTIINKLQDSVVMETGAISEKTARGKHTTRHSEFISLGTDSYILDTPGFTSLSVADIAPQEISLYFPEFEKHEPYCRFQGCMHLKEPKCGIKDAVLRGEIARERYESYRTMVEEAKERKRYER